MNGNILEGLEHRIERYARKRMHRIVNERTLHRYIVQKLFKNYPPVKQHHEFADWAFNGTLNGLNELIHGIESQTNEIGAERFMSGKRYNQRASIQPKIAIQEYIVDNAYESNGDGSYYMLKDINMHTSHPAWQLRIFEAYFTALAWRMVLYDEGVLMITKTLPKSQFQGHYIEKRNILDNFTMNW